MIDWTCTAVSPDTTLENAIRVLDQSGYQICLVVDAAQQLVGTLTDGDVRRAILRSLPMAAPVTQAICYKPLIADQDATPGELLALMTEHRLRQIPIVHDSRVVGLAHIDELLKRPPAHDTWVVLMAGGLGMRLRPLTESAPKPLIQIGDRPLLESTIERFTRQGFRRFYISVNYFADKIREYFGDGSRWHVEIRYVEEPQRMGTAGALRLIPDLSDAPLLVMNADLLTRIDFHALLDYHYAHRARATMSVCAYEVQVPFGVVEVDDHRIKGIEEKPIHSFFVNAGIYVLDPGMIDMVPPDTFFDMTTLFQKIVSEGFETAVFPLREYWLDIGGMDGLRQAMSDYERVFGLP